MFKSTGSKNSSSPSTKSHADNDILLDGLLSSGFDKGSCLSRYQSYLYRKVSPHKPSPYLISKLRSYEDLHKRCGPHTRAYKKTMVKLNKFKSNVTTGCQYIIWTYANGLGNRMVSMTSAFLYAVLTDRVLLVEFNDDMVDLFCEPFPNSTWILPKDFPFSDNNKRHHFETYQSMLKRDKKNNASEFLLPSVMHLNLQHTSHDHEKFFSCDHSQHLLHKVPLLILQSDQYFVPSLFMAPSFNQELSKMFPNKDTVFHHLGRYLFLPSNDVWGPIKRFYQAYLARADEKIGIQIRVFNPNLTPYQTIMNQVLSCSHKHKILPDFATNISNESPSKNQILKSVLVTSLYPEYGENLRTMYLNKPTVTGEIIGVYQPSHEENQKFGDNLHNKKAWTDIYLLSLCDVLVTSSLSTFGYVAQSLGGIKPWALYKLIDAKVPDSPCVQDISMEPCFHIPPKHDCMEKPLDDIGTTFPYIRRCVDYDSGVKLINDLQ
jgi:xyloglucan fucosyltransferase